MRLDLFLKCHFFTSGPPLSPHVSALNDSNWPEARDTHRKTCVMNDIDDGLDVFIGFRFFFGQPFASQRFHYDTAGFQLLLNFLCRNSLLCSGTAEDPACPVARRPEGFSHCAFLAEKKIRSSAHAAWNEDRLIGKCARCPLAMDDNALRFPIDHVCFNFRDIVCNVIDQRHVDRFPEDSLEGASGGMCNALPVRPRKICGCGHRMEISLTFRGMNRSAGQLAVRNMKTVAAHRLIQLRDVIGAHLMAQTTRTGMNEKHDGILL